MALPLHLFPNRVYAFPFLKRLFFNLFEIKVLDVHVFIMVLSEKKSKGKEWTTMSVSKYRPFGHYLGRWGYSTFGTSEMIWPGIPGYGTLSVQSCPKILFRPGLTKPKPNLTQFWTRNLFFRNSYDPVSVTFAEYKIDKQ